MQSPADRTASRRRLGCLSILAAFCLAAGASAEEIAPSAPPPDERQTLGLMRVCDLTPFGLARLDMPTAHAVAPTPVTFAFEVNLSDQNTWEGAQA